MTRAFKTKVFHRFARRSGLTDDALRAAISAAERGLVDADLGGGIIKQRIARPGGGKSGGWRTIVLFRLGHRAVFVYGFAKSERDNINAEELAAFRMLAAEMLGYDDTAIADALAEGALIEVSDDDDQTIP
ncbi:MAG: type II toxin-antitoxin system RelE/ParE family toxin [Alphaproteobacteria bacterium]|nr:type II toxin-antitoxin system RelE/ParE family toxin [Alphaproteobacteria bacterium]